MIAATVPTGNPDFSPVTSGGRHSWSEFRRPSQPVTVSLVPLRCSCSCSCCSLKAGLLLLVPSPQNGDGLLTSDGGRHVRAGAMAGSLILVPFYMCVLGLMLCGSVADSRAVFFRARYEASVAEEYDIDDGPQTFTMQDHLNFLKERELARRGESRGGALSSTMEATSRLGDQNSLIFVEDYCHTEANKKDIPIGR